MLVKKYQVVAIGLLICSRVCLATTVVAIVTPEGIVIASDGGERGHTAGSVFVSRRNAIKFVPVQKHLVVAVIGISDVSATLPDGRRYEYHFSEWIDKLQQGIPQNITPDALGDKIATEASVALEPYNELIRSGKFKPGSNPTEKFKVLIEYAIFGYSLRQPRIYDVQFFIDWDQKKVLAPKSVLLYPRPGLDTMPSVLFYSFGITQALDDKDNPASYANRLLGQCAAFRDLQAHHWDGLDGIVSIARTEIQIEKKVNPSMVFGNIPAIVILPDGTLRPVQTNHEVSCPPAKSKGATEH
jgi:hypothetical protein